MGNRVSGHIFLFLLIGLSGLAGCYRLEVAVPFLHDRVDGSQFLDEERYFLPDTRNPQHYGHTGIMLAAAYGENGRVSALIRQGESVTERDNLGMTAVHYASSTCQTDIVRLLRNAGADLNVVDNAGENVIHKAARGRCHGLVRILVQLGVPHERQNKSGVSPLMIAAKSHDSRTVEVLLEHGAQPNLTDNHRRSALHYSVRSLRQLEPPEDDDPEEEDLDARPVRWVEDQSDWVRLPLQYPIRAGVWTWQNIRGFNYARLNPFTSDELPEPDVKRVIKLLLDHGARPGLLDENLISAEQYAQQLHQEEIVELFNNRD